MTGVKTRVAAWLFATVTALAMPLVAHYEGYSLTGYADPVGIPTVCVGHTGPEVAVGQQATPEECDAWLRADVAAAYRAVVRCIGVPLKPNEAAALTSFVFNVGGNALCTSTLARIANSGAPASAWCPELDRWVYSRGQRLPGLIRRRATERDLCEGKILEFPTRRPATAPVNAPLRRAA